MNPELMLQELVGRTCVGAVAQPETCGDLLLHFAGWQGYDEVQGASLLAIERGKWSMMLRSPWRLDGPSGVVCDWRAVADSESATSQSYLVFEGLRIEAIKLTSRANDLDVVFSRGHTLRVFCDSAGHTGDCWYVLRPDDSSIAATHEFALVYEAPERPNP